MGKYWRFRGHENLDKAIFPGSGPFDVPALEPVHVDCADFLQFNQAASYTGDTARMGLHFFQHDDLFQRVWDNPDDYVSQLRRFQCVCSPDFSLYTDYPKAMQVWNHYRKHWLAAYWASKGIVVLPTIAWSDESSLSWCFSGEPVGSDVIVSSVGTQTTERSKALFLLGYKAMLARLHPTTVYFQGSVPEGVSGNLRVLPKNMTARMMRA